MASENTDSDYTPEQEEEIEVEKGPINIREAHNYTEQLGTPELIVKGQKGPTMASENTDSDYTPKQEEEIEVEKSPINI